MLIVHGLLCSRALWKLNLEALGTVCTPVTVELYGHGRSPSPTDSALYTPDNYIAEFEAIRQAIGVPQWFLCGHSLGAGLSVRYAWKYPQNTLAHIFTNSSSAFGTPLEETRPPEALIKHYETGGLDLIEQIPVHPKYGKWIPEVVKKELEEDSALLNPGGIARTIGYTHPIVSLQHHLREITPPALLICGTREKRFIPLRDNLVREIPGIEVADLEGGHAINAECYEEFNLAVVEFLGRY
ncbi:MAG: alpha/beta hydrolase [Pseudomonadales bacterium]|nr:alpha/beta hydrolase [Pseudomonadales bacterium]